MLFAHFWSIFSPSERRFKIYFEKTSKNERKSKILLSQNPPKTLPKCVQNRIPKKHTIFDRFLTERLSAANMPTLIPYWFLQYFLLVGHISSNRFLHTFWFQNACQKPFRNEVRTLEKSMQKTYWFLTSIFWRFGLDFDASWASKMEPKSQSWLEKTRARAPLERS